MKKIWNKIKNNKVFYVFLVFVIFMFPTAFYEESEFDKRAVMVALAIDKKEGEFELNGIVAIPTASVELNSNVDVIEGKGKNISEAINNMSLDVGKKVSLAHCDTLIVSKDMLMEEDLSTTLNYFLRGSQLTSNTLLIAVQGESKEFLETVMQSKSINTFLISDLVNNQESLVSASRVNIKTFFNEYYGPSGSSIMNVLEVSEEESEQGGQSGSSGGGESGSSGEQSAGKQKKMVQNNGDLLVLKNGKFVATLSDKSAQAYNLFNKTIDRGFISLDKVEDEGEIKENIGIEIVQKTTKNKYYFNNGVPTLDVNCNLIVKLTEMVVETDKKDITYINGVKTHITKGVEEAIKNYYKEGMKGIVDISKQNQVDVLKFKEKLFKFKNKEWKEFYNQLANEQSYLDNIVVNVNLDIKGKF